VTKAELAGQGDLMQRYLELKAKLESEGLFDRSRKRQLPFLPRRIGIVTSEAGAVIHDMCNVIFRRFPGIVVRLYPSLVQGAEAPAELTAGIRYFQSAFNPDLIIIARGGGSFEDLFCFNDETLVRAVAASSVPVISAVGHETDYTLCDFAADVRAGTPSIAAEIAVPKKDELISRLDVLRRSLAMRLSAKWQWFAQRIDQLSDSLSSSLTVAGERSRSRLDRVVPRLSSALKVGLVKAEAGLGRASAKLHALSPYSVLECGYSLTTAEDGSVVKDASTLSEGARIRTRFRHGEAESVVVR
jgi:exodeoxyribonuclease VII large subunit